MNGLTNHLSILLSKVIPLFRKVEGVLEDKSICNKSKVQAIRWLVLEFDADWSDDAKEYIKELVFMASICDETLGATETIDLNSFNFSAKYFLN